jgi:hypothetical protein
MRDIAPLAQVKPEIMGAINEQTLLASYAKYRNLDPAVVKSAEEVQAQTEQAQAQQEQMMQAQAAPQITGALKDVAEAKQIDPEGVGQLLNI